MIMIAKITGTLAMTGGLCGLGWIVYAALIVAAPDGLAAVINAEALRRWLVPSLVALIGGALLLIAARLLQAFEDASGKLDAMDSLARRLAEKQRASLD